MLDNPETFESLESFDWAEKHPLTNDNLKTIQSRQDEQISRLESKYAFGGKSTPKTYLQIASRYCDVDWINTPVNGIDE